MKYTIHAAEKDFAGSRYFSRVTVAGKTRHATRGFMSARDAEEAAHAWVEGQKQMAEASNGPTPLG